MPFESGRNVQRAWAEFQPSGMQPALGKSNVAAALRNGVVFRASIHLLAAPLVPHGRYDDSVQFNSSLATASESAPLHASIGDDLRAQFPCVRRQTHEILPQPGPSCLNSSLTASNRVMETTKYITPPRVVRICPPPRTKSIWVLIRAATKRWPTRSVGGQDTASTDAITAARRVTPAKRRPSI